MERNVPERRRRPAADAEPRDPELEPPPHDLVLERVRSGIDALEDLKVVFGSNFYFGCEADDPTNAWAFDTRINPLGVRLRPILGSDIGHWDVTDMSEVVEEA